MTNAAGSNCHVISYYLNSSFAYPRVNYQELEWEQTIYQDQYERSLDLTILSEKLTKSLYMRTIPFN